MPRDKDLKRLVRNRMQKTGESYTTARTHITAQASVASTADVPAPPTDDATPSTHTTTPAHRAAAADYAVVAGMSEVKLAEKTGRTWVEWVQLLDAAGADRLPHRDIAQLVHGQYDVDGWWAQTVTVGYERIKGLRERGQRRGGSFEASKSRTFHVPVDVLFDACADDALRREWLTQTGATLTTASKPRSLRMRWPDGTLVAFWFTGKGASKCSVAVQHTKVPDRPTADRLKAYWTERLEALARLLAG